MKELIAIQAELKAPKSQYNNFGKYAYRSCEDILEAVKPLLNKYDAALIVSDEIIEIGGRVYVKAKAELIFPCDKSGTGWKSVNATGWAREEESKKGMDSAQLTGSTSSYARKYALNGLLCIDDAKDADASNTHGKQQGNTNNTGGALL